MIHRVSQLLALGLVLALATAWLGTGSSGEAAPAPARDPRLAGQLYRLEGAGSCASVACHNDGGPRGAKGSEYTTWVTHDQHARAYSVLFDERSRRIQENLNRYAAPGRRVTAENNALCLRCHALDPEQLPHDEYFQLADGVGCENCHGEAGLWKTQHYLPGWRSLSAGQKADLGFHDTKDLTVRAETCVTCHVGSGAKDVNHDLIAAGHPRLNFEMGLYTAKMPRHWNVNDDKARYPDFEARAWLVGQAVSARTALELLADRAEKSREKAKPWPEFAEYACFSCHHDLVGGRELSPTQRRGYAGRVPGSFPWGTWYYALTPVLGRDVGSADRLQKGSALVGLQTIMSGASPDPGKVAEQARAAARELDGVLGDLRGQRCDPARVRRLLQAVAPPDAAHAPSSWDEAAQEYLALGALYNGLTDLDPRWRDPALRDAIQALAPSLRTPPGYSSPVTFDALAFEKQLQLVRSRLDGR
jgi:hypothetical protein